MHHCIPYAEDNLYWRLFEGMQVLSRELCAEKSVLGQGKLKK